MKKRGISGIVATVLIILLVVVAVIILFQVIKPAEKIKSSIFESEVDVVTSEGYTFYDPTNNKVSVQLQSEPESTCEKVQIILTYKDGSQTESYIFAPESNQKETSFFEINPDSTNPPISISVAPYCFEDGAWVVKEAQEVALIQSSKDANTYSGKTANDPTKDNTGSWSGGGLNETCYDSDFGININESGYVNATNGYFEDYCNSSTVIEYFCDESQAIYNFYDCHYGCSEGECINFGPEWCNGADLNRDGKVNLADYTVWRNNLGLYTKNVYTLWKNNFGRTDCALNTTECSDGIDNDGDSLIDEEDPGCWVNPTDSTTYDPTDDNETNSVSAFCYDTDGGKDYYEKGYTNSSINGGFEDYCKSESLLIEYACSLGAGESYSYSCPNGCLDGECITCSPNSSLTEDEISINIPLSTVTLFGSVLTDTDLPSLKDDAFLYNGQEYDYHEEIRLNDMKITTEYDFGYTGGDNETEYLTNQKDLDYRLVFDDAFIINDLNDSDDSALFLEIMGKKLELKKLVSYSDNYGGAEFYLSPKRVLNKGQSYTYEGKEVTLIDVYSGLVMVDVDGDQEPIQLGTTKAVNGVRIKVSNIEGYNSNNPNLANVTLRIGTEITKFYNSGEEYIGENEDDPAWIWEFKNIGSSGGYIGVKFNPNLNDLDDDVAGEKVKLVAQSYHFPNGFGGVRFDSWNENTKEGVVTVSIVGSC